MHEPPPRSESPDTRSAEWPFPDDNSIAPGDTFSIERPAEEVPPLDRDDINVSQWSLQTPSTRSIAPTHADVAPPTSTGTPMAYRLERRIGRGGFAEVWEAVQVSLSRVVAIKRPHRGGGEDTSEVPLAARTTDHAFRQEALTTANLQHPNIIPVHDLGMDEQGQPVLAMKRVSGKPWNELIWADEKKPLADLLAKHLPILVSVAQAVAFAHSRGVLHRDLKPQQVMVGDFGEVVLMDWGLAMLFDVELARREMPQLADSGIAPDRTNAPNPAGTPAYMAPEQTDKATDRLGPATDVYLLGGTLFYLLSGTTPHHGRTSKETYQQATQGELQPLRPRRDGDMIPRELEELTTAALAADPSRRVPDARSFIAAVQDFITGASRRRESAELTDAVEREFAANGKATRDYEALSAWRTQAQRAITLWHGNAQAHELLDAIVGAMGDAAIANDDLGLAQSLAMTLANPAARERQLGRIVARRAEIASVARQRKLLLGVSALLLVVLVISGLIFQASLAVQKEKALEASEKALLASRQEAKSAAALVEEATRRAREAERARYATDMRLASDLLDASRTDEALRVLLATAKSERDLGWGLMVRRARPELLTLDAHTSTVTSLAVSTDGTRLLSSSRDRTAALFDLPTATLIRRFDGHDAPLRLSVLSPDAAVAATAEVEGRLQLWDTRTGAALGTWHWDVWQAEFSPDGRRLAVTGRDRDARVIELDKGNRVETLRGHLNEVRGAHFSPDGKFLLTASYDNTAILWDTSDWSRTRTFSYHSRGLADAVFSADGARVMTVSHDSSAGIWDIRRGELKNVLRGHQGTLTGGVFSPDGTQAVTASSDGTARIWDMTMGFELFTLRGHGGEIQRMALSPRGNALATVGADGTARLWNPESGAQLSLLTDDASAACAPIFVLQGGAVAVGLDNGQVRVWMPSGEAATAISSQPGNAVTVLQSSGPDALLVGRADGSVRSITSSSGAPITTHLDSGPSVSALGRVDESATLVVGSAKGLVKEGSGAGKWTVLSDRPVRDIVSFGDEGTLVLEEGALWSSSSRVRSVQRDFVAVSAKRDVVLAEAGGGLLVVGDRNELRTVAKLTDPPTRILLSGSTLVIGTRSGRIGLWRGFPEGDASRIAWLLGHAAPVTSLDDSGRGTFVSADAAGVIRLWDLVAGAPIAILPGKGGAVAAAFESEGVLVSGSADGRVLLWEPAPWHDDALPGDPSGDWSVRFASWQRARYLRLVPQLQATPDTSTADRLRRASRDRFEAVSRLLEGATGPLSVSQQRSIREGTPLRMVVFIRQHAEENRVFISGNTPDIGNWEPCRVAFTHVSTTPYGHFWEFRTTWRPMQFKLMWGRDGEGWSAGEWWGIDNRELPGLGAQLYQLPDGSVLLLCEFGKRPL